MQSIEIVNSIGLAIVHQEYLWVLDAFFRRKNSGAPAKGDDELHETTVMSLVGPKSQKRDAE